MSSWKSNQYYIISLKINIKTVSPLTYRNPNLQLSALRFIVRVISFFLLFNFIFESCPKYGSSHIASTIFLSLYISPSMCLPLSFPMPESLPLLPASYSFLFLRCLPLVVSLALPLSLLANYTVLRSSEE